MTEKYIQLKPSWSYLFWWYVAAFLLIPVFGIGLIVLYLAYKKQSSLSYIISDRSISGITESVSDTIDLANINHIEVQQRWIEKKMGTGKLLLITESRTIEMVGMDNPHSLSDMILKAAESERIRLKKEKLIPKTSTGSAPVSLDRLDYLTGLWQQGLLSDEEFKKEKRHFEP